MNVGLGMRVRLLCLLLPGLAIVLLVGCKKKVQANATQPLQQSFQTAEPQIKQNIEVATSKLKAGDYLEATKALAPVVSGQPLTEAQRKAVGVALQQINQAIAANPALDTKEMYDLRAKLFRAVDKGH